MFDIKITRQGIFGRTQPNNDFYQKNIKRIYKAYSVVVKKVSLQNRAEIKNLASQRFRVKKPNYLNTFSSRVFDSKPDSFASFWIFSKVHYYKIFSEGGTIHKKGKKLLLPINADRSKKMTRRVFKNKMKKLFDGGDFFIKKKGNKSIVFAKMTDKNKGLFAAEKRFVKATNKANKARAPIYQVSLSSRKKITKKAVNGVEYVPVAVLMDAVVINKKLNFDDELMAKNQRDIQREFNDELDKTAI